MESILDHKLVKMLISTKKFLKSPIYTTNSLVSSLRMCLPSPGLFKLINVRLKSFKLRWFIFEHFERTQRSWKEPVEVGKNQAKFESFFWSWKVSLKLESFAAVGKFWLKLESLNELGKLWRVTRKIYGPGWKYTVLTAENIRSLGWKYTVLGLKYTVLKCWKYTVPPA